MKQLIIEGQKELTGEIKISDLTNNFERKIILYNKYKNRK
mgnify:CR=1 FL=1